MTPAFLGVEASSGPPPVADVGPSDMVASPRVLSEFVGLNDPLAWSTHAATGLLFRRATVQEIGANDWAPGAFLVATGPNGGATPGASTAMMLIPQSDTSAVSLTLNVVGSQGDVAYFTHIMDGEPSVSVPTFYRYETALPAGPYDPETFAAGGLITAEAAGFFGEAVVGRRQADVVAFEPSWQITTIPGPQGQVVTPSSLTLVQLAPFEPAESACGVSERRILVLELTCANASAAVQCSNGIDDDLDGWTDHPNDPGCSSAGDNSEEDSRTTYRFGLVGETKWCTAFVANWPAILAATAVEITAGFRVRVVKADPAIALADCWISPTLVHALGCDNTGGCRDLSGHNYPFNGCKGSSTCYRDRAWSSVSHARQHEAISPWPLGTIKLAQVQHFGELDGGGLCGLSRFPPGGDSVSIARPYVSTGCRDFVSTHEVGHSFNAVHEKAADVGPECRTVMASSYTTLCRLDYFSDANRRAINDCIKASNCPRSGSG